MAGRLSTYQANKVLNKLLLGEDYVVPSSWWIGVFKCTNDVPLRNNSPSAALEVDAAGYARLEVRGSTTLTFTQSTVGSSQMSDVLAWPAASAPWGTITYVAVMDALTGGNVILYGALSSPKSVDSAETFRLPSGLFVITL